VIRTRVGYTGGKSKDPSYRNMMDHTESVQLEFDPAQISYDKLLSLFWKGHSPICRSSAQYKSGIWFHNPEQEKKAKESMIEQEKKLSRKVYTDIESAATFYIAEDYHQKFEMQRYKNILQILKFGSLKEMIDSPLATKLNGYYGGHGSMEQIMVEITKSGLNEEAKSKLEIALGRHFEVTSTCGYKK